MYSIELKTNFDEYQTENHKKVYILNQRKAVYKTMRYITIIYYRDYQKAENKVITNSNC